MYARPSDRIDASAATELLRAAPFMHLVSHDNVSFAATSLPMLVDTDDDTVVRLVGHVARANSHWKSLDGQRVIAIASPSDGYVSPSWYPSKAELDGKVVPTWNYEAVHIHGVARVHHDIEWLLDLVTRLTDLHESDRTDGGERWSVDDAPADFIAQQLQAIVGISVEVEKIDAKRKLSENRSAEDRGGVVDGLRRSGQRPNRLLRSMMQ